MLENVIDSPSTEKLEYPPDVEGNQMLVEDRSFFQQDEASKHYAVNIQNWLNQRFSDH